MTLIEKRSPGVCILLSIVTCGIYGIYWYYKVLDDLYKANNIPSTALTDIVLSFVTCGIYAIYLQYKMGKLVSSAFELYRLPYKDDSIMFLILSLFGLAIINYCIIQSDLNNMLADNVNRAYNEYRNSEINPRDYDQQ